MSDDIGPLPDHEIALVFATFPEHWSVVRACRELVVLRQLRDVVREVVASGRLDMNTKRRLEELCK